MLVIVKVTLVVSKEVQFLWIAIFMFLFYRTLALHVPFTDMVLKLQGGALVYVVLLSAAAQFVVLFAAFMYTMNSDDQPFVDIFVIVVLGLSLLLIVLHGGCFIFAPRFVDLQFFYRFFRFSPRYVAFCSLANH